MTNTSPLRVGIGGPVGSGKTALTLALCQALRDQIDMAVVTNDIYTAEDAKFLVSHAAQGQADQVDKGDQGQRRTGNVGHAVHP